jgi:titin
LIAKFSFNVPDAPGEPELVESGSNFVNLTWTRPESDGGDSITGYWIEKREKGYDKWIRTNTNQIQSTSYIVTNLYENRDYEFRVLAENQAGLSEPSKTSKLIQVKDPNAASVPKFSVHLQDTEAGLGKTAHFECQIVASQTLDVRFFKDKKNYFTEINIK